MPRSARPLLAAALVLLAALAVAAPAQAISIAPQSPRSPNAEGIATTYWVMLAIAALVVTALHAVLIAAVVRFRASRNRRVTRVTARRGTLRPAVGALSVVAVAILIFGVVMTADVRSVEPTGPAGLDPGQGPTAQVGVSDVPAEPEAAPLEVNAIAQQWVWRFEYPGHQPGQPLFSYGELVVPVDTAVVVSVRSIDVAHSWWIPALGGQVQALPGSVNETWFKATEEGRYEGHSTMFSGSGFPSMRAWVRVVSASEYQSYLDSLASDLEEATSAVAGEVAGENGDVEGAPEVEEPGDPGAPEQEDE